MQSFWKSQRSFWSWKLFQWAKQLLNWEICVGEMKFKRKGILSTIKQQVYGLNIKLTAYKVGEHLWGLNNDTGCLNTVYCDTCASWFPNRNAIKMQWVQNMRIAIISPCFSKAIVTPVALSSSSTLSGVCPSFLLCSGFLMSFSVFHKHAQVYPTCQPIKVR